MRVDLGVRETSLLTKAVEEVRFLADVVGLAVVVVTVVVEVVIVVGSVGGAGH